MTAECTCGGVHAVWADNPGGHAVSCPVREGPIHSQFWDDLAQDMRDPEFRAAYLDATARMDLARRVLDLIRDCPDHPMPLPKPSCPACARNGGITAAAHLVARSSGEAPS